MIKTGSDVLFQEPTCDTRRLRRSVVVDASADEFCIQFVAEPFALAPDQEVLMYFNGKREFMQQIGRITEIIEPDPVTNQTRTFRVEPVGDVISAENRQNYRVSVISANLEASIGNQERLRVPDLSSTGFAVLASGGYPIGQTVKVTIAHGDERCHGIASIQSIREFGPGRVRYGMRAIEEDPHTGSSSRSSSEFPSRFSVSSSSGVARGSDDPPSSRPGGPVRERTTALRGPVPARITSRVSGVLRPPGIFECD